MLAKLFEAQIKTKKWALGENVEWADCGDRKEHKQIFFYENKFFCYSCKTKKTRKILNIENCSKICENCLNRKLKVESKKQIKNMEPITEQVEETQKEENPQEDIEEVSDDE